jgi:hypothetical protein
MSVYKKVRRKMYKDPQGNALRMSVYKEVTRKMYEGTTRECSQEENRVYKVLM